MSFVRSLATDLRERHVLPAVLLLLVLAIAIPVASGIVLSKSSTLPAIPTAPVATDPPRGLPAPGGETLLAQSAPTVHWHTFKGSERDPFATTGAVAHSVTSPKSATPSSTTSTTKPSLGKPTTTAPPKTRTTKPAITSTTPAPAPASLSSDEAYTIDATTTYGSEQDTLENIERLTPLPANVDAEMVYLGVVKGGKRAAILLTASVSVKLTASGSVTCVPSATNCEVAELAPGQQLTLTPDAGDSGVETFTFKLNSIKAQSFSDASEAKNAREAASSAGGQIIAASTSSGLASFFYDLSIGALVYEPQTQVGSSGSSGSSGTTGVSNAAAVDHGDVLSSTGH